MTEITLFRFENSELSAVMRSGEPWFFADDACAILDIKNSRDAIAKLDDDEKGVVLTDTLGGYQNKAVISESGLYTLTLRCRDAMKPGTKPHRFRKWVTSDVIPSIRKTGGFSIQVPQQTLSREQQLASAVLLSQDIIREKDEKIAALAPKAESFDALANLEGRHNLRSAAAQCGWPQNKFIDKLISIGWIYVNTATGRKHAYSDRIKTGMMEVKNVEVKRTGYTEGVGQPMITQKGLARLKMLLGVYQVAPSREMELH